MASPSPPSTDVVPAVSAWALEIVRGVDPVLGLALLTIVAVVLAEALHRALRLPRASGYLLAGAMASPLALRVLDRAELDPWKPLIDLAIAMLVFELGTRIRPGWLKDNPWFALTCLLEGALAGLAVAGALVLLGVSPLSAAVVGAVAMSTSPVIVMAVLHESAPRGQVTERLLMMTAVNGVMAVVALKAWRVVAAVPGRDLLSAGTGALWVVSGSLLLGAVVALLLELAGRRVRGTSAMPVLQMALIITASILAVQWTLSPLLALLVAGMVARTRMRHQLTVEPQLGTAGAALGVLLFLCLGVLLTVEGATRLWPMVLAILLARMLGQAGAIFALARPSGLGWRQSAALTLALQPMSSLALLLAADTFAWATQLPGVERQVLQALLAATTLMQLTGPVWTTLALRLVARESQAH